MSDLFNMLADVTVLVVDDDVYAQNYLEKLLVMTGVSQILSARDGQEALDILSDHKVDMALLDINMKPMHGLEFLKHIRIGEANCSRDLPVIVLSGTVDDFLLGTALALDCNAFLNKPSSQAELAEKIRSILLSSSAIRPSKAYQVIPTDLAFRMMPSKPQNDDVPDDAVVVRLDELQPGQVLARDIYTVRGNILLTAGTSLTQEFISRLGEISDSAGLDLVVIKDTVCKQNKMQLG